MTRATNLYSVLAFSKSLMALNAFYSGQGEEHCEWLLLFFAPNVRIDPSNLKSARGNERNTLLFVRFLRRFFLVLDRLNNNYFF